MIPAHVASKLLNPQMKSEFIQELAAEYQLLREKGKPVHREIVSLEDAQKNRLNLF